MDRIIDNKRYIWYSSLSSELKMFYQKLMFHFFYSMFFEYRGFNDWYNRLFDDKCNLRPEREIIICEVDYTIAAIAILKNSNEEKKLCTLRVAKRYRNCGIAHQLMEIAFEVLKTEKPMFTVHQRRLAQFKPLFDYYGFQPEQSKKNYYGLFNTELVYNGVLPEKHFLIERIKIWNVNQIYEDYLMSGIKGLNEYFDAWKKYGIGDSIYI